MGVVSGWFGSRLARYLFRTPPVPQPWRRRMLSLGSGDLGSGIRCHRLQWITPVIDTVTLKAHASR